ncbi:MAG: hypothetical protein Q7S14_02700 [bacterium]|nr:hypothetical protein [bacterium]
MGNIVQNVFEIPGEFLRIAHKQIVGLPDEKQQSQIAKRKLPGLVASDQKMAAVKISQIQQQLLQHAQNKASTAGPEIKSKPKLPPIAVRNMYNKSNQTSEMKFGE